MTLDEEGVVTLYECKHCTRSIVGVLTDDPDLAMTAPQALTRWQEKAGHHLRGYIIGARSTSRCAPRAPSRTCC